MSDLPRDPLPLEELRALEREVSRAFRGQEPDARLEVLGYGEISSVLGWRTAQGRFACKRLPPFDSEARLGAYSGLLGRYLEALEAHGVRPVRSELQVLPRDGGPGYVCYCVQPALPAEELLTRVLARAPEQEALALLGRVVGAIQRVVSPGLGLDGQASNWILQGGELCYLDVTTPMLRGPDGEDLLDTDLFLASAPWAARPLLRRFLLPGILDKYHSPRGVVLDLLGNLHKERLERLIAPFLARAPELAPWVAPPLSAEEIRRYYRSDARVWALWQRLRRADRWWQLRVRRRAYPFLLPARIER